MNETDFDTSDYPSGGTSLLVSIPLISGGLYTLLNHGEVHGAVHETITPEALAGVLAWMLWGLEIVALLNIVLLIALVIFLVVGAIVYLL